MNSLAEFQTIFGEIEKNKLAGHAVAEYFSAKTLNNSLLPSAVQFTRVLGISSDKAGFKFEALNGSDSKIYGGVQFLVAEHIVNDDEWFTTGMFFNNETMTTNYATPERKVELVRAMFLVHKDCRLAIFDSAEKNAPAVNSGLSIKVINKPNSTAGILERSIKLDFDPTSAGYLTKALNTDPSMIDDFGYVLYLDFPVAKSVAEVSDTMKVALTREASGDEYGFFNSAFRTPRSPKFLSQPFGTKEFELFHFESLDDGAYASLKHKISITNLRASTDVDYKYGTFNVEIRDLYDTDDSPVILEQFTNLCLDPTANNYIAKIIGDKKMVYNFSDPDEKRIFVEGEFENQSRFVRVVMNSDVKEGKIPVETLPFGFKGVPVLKTTSTNKDSGATYFETGSAGTLTGSLLPPLPMRFKITKGAYASGSYLGQANAATGEAVNNNLYWGLSNYSFDSILDPNTLSSTNSRFNDIVSNYLKFMGTTNVMTDDEADDFQFNKFSLSKVAFSGSAVSTINSSVITDTLKDAIYVRSAKVGTANQDAIDYKIDMTQLNKSGSSENRYRVTFASLLSEDKVKFNKYSNYTKFTAPMFGGFDGLNIFDFDSVHMNDLSTSTSVDAVSATAVSAVNGKASSHGFRSALATYDNSGAGSTMQGAGVNNNIIHAYRNAIDLILDDATGVSHILVLPGIKEPLITDYAATKVRDYGRAIYLMDIVNLDKDGQRLYRAGIDGSRKPDVDLTISNFQARNIDNNYVATYFPDTVMIDQSDSLADKRSIVLPSSIAALGALARSESQNGGDSPWFAPAGFSKGALPNVRSVVTRLKALDRDNLYEARINPIATFPGNEFVIFGQKTLQLANTALTRVNVRRLMVAIKRRIETFAQGLLFEQNTAGTRASFKQQVESYLADVKIKQGIENFRVVINDDPQEADNNILSGKIIVVPTRVIEFIAMDFVVTNSGVQFN